MRSLVNKAVLPLRRGWERLRWSSYYTPLDDNIDPAVHIREAAQWLARAQDTGSDRGVSYGARFGQTFLPSYAETTGYIICTFLQLADLYGHSDYIRRAREAARWEIDMQMECGAVMSGTADQAKVPAVFNTGQVLLGWADLYHRTGDEDILHAGNRAADWMISLQETNGTWVRGNAQWCLPEATIYNVKSAWGLAEFGKVAGRQDAVAAAIRNAEFVLDKQKANGWFDRCCLSDPLRPLLHTIAYTMQGLIGIGKLANRADFIAAAQRTADSLLAIMEPDGFIPGRILGDMTGAVSWSCLTGTAQTAIVWWELYRLSGKETYRKAALRANRYLMRRHDISSSNPAIRGGLAGSWPTWSEYGRLMVLNWATKFLVDSLIYEVRLASGVVPV